MDIDKQQVTTVGQYLLDRLHELGLKHIFGVPGDYVLSFNKAIEVHSHIEFINTTREDTAGFAADAYARLTGLGVACITYGVGIHIVNALSQAYVESSPLVVISGTAGTEEYKKNRQRHHLINTTIALESDLTQSEIFKHVTIDQGILTSPQTAAEIIDRVLQSCLTHQKPVYLEIPRNQVNQLLPQKSPLKIESHQVISQEPLKEPLKEALAETLAILSCSQRPLIWAGHEILRFGLSHDLLQFAEMHQIPIFSSLLGKTVIDEHHPLFKGVYQGEISPKESHEAVLKCDCFLMLGLTLSDLDTGMYTAKTNHDHQITAAQNSLKIGHHHYQITLKEYIQGLKTLDLSKTFDDRMIPKHSQSLSVSQALTSNPDAKTTTKHVFQCLQKYLTPDHLIVSDIGDCLFASTDLVLSHNSFLCNSYFGSLGFGVPGAIGAQLAQPERRVIAIIGDGAFQMTAMELSTAVRYHIDPIIILLNNHGYGTERILLEGNYNDIQNWNYTLIPKVLGGGIGMKVETELAFQTVLQQAIAQRGEFYLIEVELEKLDFSPALHRLGELLEKVIRS